MAEPLKAMYDGSFLEDFGRKLKSAWPDFDEERFAAEARREDWDTLELKPRIRRITEALGASLPRAYAEAIQILYRIDEECVGFPYLFFPDFIEVYGQNEADWELSMDALARFTKRSSSEFAVRPFIAKDQERMLPLLMKWAGDDSEHVRRLASEGSRPRLPWGAALVMFKKDPSPMLPVLDKLKSDPSLYVRKSVANHLNDIAKDHPELVLTLAERWKGEHHHTDWIIRHACRTLIKRADSRALALFGYAPSSTGESEEFIQSASLSLTNDELPIGGETMLHYRIHVRDGSEGDKLKLRVEYGIDFVKSGGKTSLKRFLLSDREFSAGEALEHKRVHRFADLTTRKHYPGRHAFTLWVNGIEVARAELELTAAARK